LMEGSRIRLAGPLC